MTATFHKEERLCSKLAIDSLFEHGGSCFAYPLRLVYMPNPPVFSEYPCQVIFSVPKRLFKRAVKRNLIRRRMREAYRLNKTEWYQAIEQSGKKISLLMIFTGKEESDYATIEKGMKKGMKKVIDTIQ